MIFILLGTLAQAADTRLWLSSGLDIEPTKKLDVKLTQHVRFEDNVSSLDTIIPELELEFAPLKWAEIGGGYRYIAKWNKELEYDPAHRAQGDLGFKKEFKKWEPSYRFRIQRSWEQDKTLKIETRRRHRFKLTHDTTKELDLSIAGQTFRDPSLDVSHATLRLTAGAKFKIKKDHKLSVAYNREAPLSRIETTEQHIFSLGYVFELSKKSKDSSKPSSSFDSSQQAHHQI